MNPQTTLNAVRELSERAMLRPAPTRLRLARAADLRPGPRPATIPYEELHPPRRIGIEVPMRASGYRQRKGTVPKDAPPAEKDFLKLAVEKTAPKPVILPPLAA
jgi:hypothetical protein